MIPHSNEPCVEDYPYDTDDFSREDELQRSITSYDRVRRNIFPCVDEGVIIPGYTRKSYTAIIILCVINFINYMNRYSIAGASKDIKAFYTVTEGQFHLLQMVFIIGYIVVAPVWGYFGDRCNRRVLLSFGIAFWSVTTFAESFISPGNFKIFLLLRVLVGAGEASCTILGPTLIADHFVRNSRSKMLALFYLTVPVGSCLGYIIPPHVASLFGSWQWNLRIIPIVGVICSIVAFAFIREPQRGQIEGGSVMQVSSIYSDFLDLYKTPSFVWSILGWTCTSFTIGTITWFGQKYFELALHLQSGFQNLDVSLLLQVFPVIAGIIGIVTGSSASQYCRHRNLRADSLICAFGVLVSIPFIFSGIVIANKQFIIAIVFLFIGEIFLFMNISVVADVFLYVVIPTRRSLGEAVQLFVSCLLGDASSSYICGIVADAISKYQSNRISPMGSFLSLQYSLYIPVVVLVIGGLCFFLAARHIEKDRIRCTLVTHGIIPPLHVHQSDLIFPQPVQLAADHVYPSDRAYLI